MRLTETKLFQGIGEKSIEEMSKCLSLREKRYGPQERIARYEGRAESLGLLLEGEARLVRSDYDGRLSVLEDLREGDVFGETLAFGARTGSEVCVYAQGACRVVFLDFAHLTRRCPKACRHHSALVENMLLLVSEKANRLSERVDVLSGRSIRERLLNYFRLEANAAGGDQFTMPFSLTDLAEYLCVDRSAMSRELKTMREQGILEIDRKKVTLLPESP